MLPSIGLLIMALAMSIVRFENQRWLRARRAGMRGRCKACGVFVDTTGILGALFSYAFLGAYLYDKGLYTFLIFMVLVGALALGISVLINRLCGGDHPAVWVVSTFLMWPLAVLLFFQVTWFGVVRI